MSKPPATPDEDSEEDCHQQLLPEQPAQKIPEQKAPEQKVPEESSLTFWQMLGSTLAAALGVQSSKNRERDFAKGKAIHFVALGVGFTVVFVVVMVLIVRTVLSSAG